MAGTLLTVLIFLFLAVVGLLVVAATAVRIVREYERVVVFRFGRSLGVKGPGLVLLIPFIDQAVKVDLREQFLEVPHQVCITLDNATVSVDFLIYWKVIDAESSVLKVGQFERASIGIATTTLRAVIGDIELDAVLSQREHINQVLRVKLDEVTERWGVKVTAVEIREIEPPQEIRVAMNRQMAAERNRRATVLDADGQREASVMVAEGEKQSAVLRAEGEKQSAILAAEGQREAQRLQAEGFAVALNEIWERAREVDPNTMALQYFETLKRLGESASTKFIFPMEFTGMLESFIEGQKGE
ncbi:MAG: SPFH domain-containing protein [Anaerolineae bacterium]|jgi:regulator of protease activity HflC (stomatin/prohibitin superfamily)